MKSGVTARVKRAAGDAVSARRLGMAVTMKKNGIKLKRQPGLFLDPLAGGVVEKIADGMRPEKIYLFGSRVSGGAGPDSDVDVLLVYSGNESPHEVQLKAQRLFRPASFSLDVFVLSRDTFEAQKRVANTLAREVSETGILCYG